MILERIYVLDQWSVNEETANQVAGFETLVQPAVVNTFEKQHPLASPRRLTDLIAMSRR